MFYQHVGMARRRDKTQAEAFEIVERVVERVYFELAAIAGAGIDLADRQAAAKPAVRGAVDLLCELGKRGVVGRRRRFGDGRADQVLEQYPAHDEEP
jgi:hypothetical protein